MFRNPLHSQSDFHFVPLFGLGLGYTLVEGEPILAAAADCRSKGCRGEKVLLRRMITGLGSAAG